MRSPDEGTLYRRLCEIAVEYGRFTFAWVGVLDARDGATTRVASAGEEAGCLVDDGAASNSGSEVGSVCGATFSLIRLQHAASRTSFVTKCRKTVRRSMPAARAMASKVKAACGLRCIHWVAASRMAVRVASARAARSGL